MTLSHRMLDDTIVLDVAGRLSIAEGAGRLKERVSSLISDEHRRIVINLSDLKAMDSTGLGELVACHTTAQRNGVPLKLTGLNGRVHDLLVVAKLLTVFDVYDTEDEATASFDLLAGPLGN